MLNTKITQQHKRLTQMISSELSAFVEKFGCDQIFLTQRGEQIVGSFMTDVDIYAVGVKKIINKQNISPYMKFKKIIVLMCVNQQSLREVDEYLYLFESCYILNLDISHKSQIQNFKQTQLSEKSKGYYEISINFTAYLDQVYQLKYKVNKSPRDNNKREQQSQLLNSLASYLISGDKFYQFQIYHNQKDKMVAQEFKRLLKSKLQVLQRHKYPNYNQNTSPKTKLLIIDRSEDPISPLLYGFYYGSICQELGITKNNKFHSVFSQIYNDLYTLDIMQASEYLQKLAQKKQQCSKLQTHNNSIDVSSAKQLISNNTDPNASSTQILIHLEAYRSVQKFCENKTKVSVLQQNIANGIDQSGKKVGSSGAVQAIRKLIKQKTPIVQTDYLKLVMLCYLCHSLWFFQKNELNELIPSQYIQKLKAFQNQVKGNEQTLQQKEQQPDKRLHLYRHKSRLLTKLQQFLEKEQAYKCIEINKTMKKRDTKLIVYVHGDIGVNEIPALLKQIRNAKYSQWALVCGNVVTSGQYMEDML